MYISVSSMRSSTRTVLSSLSAQIEVTMRMLSVDEEGVMRFRTTAMRQDEQASTISMSAMSSGASGSDLVCCE